MIFNKFPRICIPNPIGSGIRKKGHRVQRCPRIARRLFLIALLLPFVPACGPCLAHATDSETMLMFVGEDLDVLSIATRREESAAKVPAVAQVITRKQIRERGLRTLSQALALIPGFYVAEKEGGSQAYLRGIPGGVLFLYDTVPLGSEISKSLQFLDHEISMEAVKRIEIVRGPGSVLWGPDAFAGVVNIVPLEGGDLQGAETGLSAGLPGDQVGAYANAGRQRGIWDTMLSISARRGQEDDTPATITRFWAEDGAAIPPDQREGEAEPDDAYYLEATGRVAYGDLFSLSGRIADARRPYTMTDQNSENAWIETHRIPSGHIKLEGKHDFHFDSAIRFSGSYRWVNPEYEIIDRTVQQRENTAYAELVVDKAFWAGTGLFTGGVSYRDNRIDNAPIWDGYLPDYLNPENDDLAPQLEQVDYDTQLASVFGQYIHKLGTLDLMAGLRYDEHDEYKSATSYNLAAVWAPGRQWTLKLLHGMAFRTPFARQLRENEGGAIDPEKIINTSAQVDWHPSDRLDTNLTVFHNRIEDHVNEDPYAGLSNPNSQKIYGLEAQARWRIDGHWALDGALTVLNSSGPDEVYRYNDYSYVDEDGNWVDNYVDLIYPYDTGAKQLFSLSAIWNPIDRFNLTPTLRYIGSRDLIYPRSETVTSCDGVWLVDLAATLRRVWKPDADLTLTVKNLFDRDYDTPGTYSLIEGQRFTAEIVLRVRW